MNDTPLDISDMKRMPLHRRVEINMDLAVLRVPNGWIYLHLKREVCMGIPVTRLACTTFVPQLSIGG